MGLRPSHANTQGNNPKDRYGLAKVPFSLIPSTALVFLARGLGHGARKYGPFNWRVEPVQGRVYLEAALRHIQLLLDGEDFDRDTGDHHGAFVLSTMAIYLDAMVQGTLIDNRPLAGRTGDLVAYFNELPGQVRTRSQLVEGFKRLTPNGHLLVDALEPTELKISGVDISHLIVDPKGPPTKRPSDKGRRLSDLDQGVHADLHMGVVTGRTPSRNPATSNRPKKGKCYTSRKGHTYARR